MRVLIATPDFPPARGGIQVLLERLAHHLSGHEVVVATIGEELGVRPDTALPHRVIRVGLPGSRQASLLALNAALPAIAARIQAQIVVCGHIICGPGALLTKRILKIPVIQYAYALELTGRAGLAAKILPWVDATVAISEYAKGLAIAGGARADRISVINPGVAPPVAVHALPKEPVIVTVARLSEHYKGFDVMLRALPLVLARVPDARWIVLGEGPLRAALRTTAAATGLDGHVSFLGQVSDAERDEWLMRARVFSMPSRVPARGAGEGFGIVFLEAGRFGVPSVTGHAGGSAEAVLDGVTGTQVDPRDHLALAEALTELLVDDELCQRYGAAARARAAELSWERMGQQVGTLIERVTSN